MKLPNAEHALTPEKKLAGYLLDENHVDGGGKAKFFLGHGFTQENWQVLGDALWEHAQSHDITKMLKQSDGVKYVVEGELNTPDGRTPIVRVVWMIDTGADIPRLISAYPQ